MWDGCGKELGSLKNECEDLTGEYYTGVIKNNYNLGKMDELNIY
jgi:hypothetical protein